MLTKEDLVASVRAAYFISILDHDNTIVKGDVVKNAEILTRFNSALQMLEDNYNEVCSSGNYELCSSKFFIEEFCPIVDAFEALVIQMSRRVIEYGYDFT